MGSLPTQPEVLARTFPGSFPSLGFHPHSVVPATFQLRRTILGPDIPDCHGLLLKVAGGRSSVRCFLTGNHTSPEEAVMHSLLDTLVTENKMALTSGEFQDFTTN